MELLFFSLFRLNYYERTKDQFIIIKLEKEIGNHYLNQLLKQINVVVLGLDVLGNPSGVAEGVESFFYEPYKIRSFYFYLKTFSIPFEIFQRAQWKIQWNFWKVLP